MLAKVICQLKKWTYHYYSTITIYHLWNGKMKEMNWKSGHKLCQSLVTLCVRRRSKFSGSSRPLDFAQFCWSRCDCCVANDLARKIQRCANLKSVIDSSIQWLCLSCDDGEANIERWELPVGLQNWSLCYQHLSTKTAHRITASKKDSPGATYWPTGRRLMPRSDRPTFGIPAMLKDSQSLSSASIICSHRMP